MISDDFAFQNFLVNEVSTAYMAAKFGKIYDANVDSEDEEDAYGMATEMRKYLSF